MVVSFVVPASYFIADDVMCALIPKEGYLKQHLYSKMQKFFPDEE